MQDAICTDMGALGTCITDSPLTNSSIVGAVFRYNASRLGGYRRQQWVFWAFELWTDVHFPWACHLMPTGIPFHLPRFESVAAGSGGFGYLTSRFLCGLCWAANRRSVSQQISRWSIVDRPLGSRQPASPRRRRSAQHRLRRTGSLISAGSLQASKLWPAALSSFCCRRGHLVRGFRGFALMLADAVIHERHQLQAALSKISHFLRSSRVSASPAAVQPGWQMLYQLPRTHWLEVKSITTYR